MILSNFISIDNNNCGQWKSEGLLHQSLSLPSLEEEEAIW